MTRKEEAIGVPKGSGNPEMLIGAVELPFPEPFDAVLLLWHNLNLADDDVGGRLLLLQLLLLLLARPAARLAGS